MIAPGPFTHRDALDTEHAAAAVTAPTLRERQLAVLRAIRRRPRTADEVAKVLDLRPLQVRPRLSELRAAGLIAPTQVRRPNAEGNSCAVWYVTAAGLDALDGLSQ